MIQSIEINGFRGIRTGGLDDLSPLVILIGPNGCGKSTVLEGAYIAGAVEPNATVQRCINRRDGREARWLVNIDSPHAALNLTTDKGRSVSVRILLNDKGFESGFFDPDGTLLGHTRPIAAKADAKGMSRWTELVDAGLYESKRPLHDLYTDAARIGHRQDAHEDGIRSNLRSQRC